MQGKTHLIGGALTASIGTLAFSSDSSLMLLPAMAMGSLGGLFPDIDHKSSKISQKMKPVSALVRLFFSHRGFFHTPILYLGLWLIWKFIPIPSLYSFFGNCFFAGTLSHLVLDLLNTRGIPAFFPISTKHVRLGQIQTGSYSEFVIRLFLTIGCLLLCLYQLFRFSLG